MALHRWNESCYRYEATFHVCNKDKSEEIKRVCYNTDILYNHLHFWNKKRLLCKYRGLAIEEEARKKQMVICELLREDFVLIPKFRYIFID